MTQYAFMSKAKYEEVASTLVHGVRFSMDEQQVVAKLASGQQIEGAIIQSHEEAAATVSKEPWVPSEPLE